MKAFSRDFPYLETRELIEYYAVFDGYEKPAKLREYDNLTKNINENILKKYHDLKYLFIFSDDLQTQKDIEKLLFRICVGDRKIYSIYKNDISQHYGSSLYKILFSKKVIQKEHSREKPFRLNSNQIKKEFRGYKIEDKIKFSKNFYRFWFTFIAPNRQLIEKEEFSKVLQKIEKELDKYISLTFETLSNELILKSFDCEMSGSYWDRQIELDLLTKTSQGEVIAGESKWKNQKISKNTLNKLQKKCSLANFDVKYFALFSKSGFSNELLKNRDKNILLYDIDSFKELINA